MGPLERGVAAMLQYRSTSSNSSGLLARQYDSRLSSVGVDRRFEVSASWTAGTQAAHTYA